jgi:membrane fusion protein (multidrug efflux system)
MATDAENQRGEPVAPAPLGGEPEGRARRRIGAALRSRPHLGRTLLIGVPIVLVAIVLAWRYFAARETTDDAQIDGHITPIAARVGGTVLTVKVDDNEVVHGGAVLVEIDPRDYRIALQRAEAELADAQAALVAARNGIPITTTTTASQVSVAGANVEQAEAGTRAAAREVDAARARLNVAQARLEEATANATRAERDRERLKQLVAKDEVSEQQYDAAVAAADAARASVESARAAIVEAERGVEVAESRRVQADGMLVQARADLRAAETAPEQVKVTRSRADSAEARVKLAQAALAQARLNLQYTTVVAPSAGVVSKKSVEPGQVVQPGQPLLALVSLDDIWVTANFKETQLHSMRPGQRATISVDAYGRSYEGHVDSIAAATGARFSLLPPENATGNYVKVVQRIPVKIVFEKGQDPQHLLRPGMSVVPTVMVR